MKRNRHDEQDHLTLRTETCLRDIYELAFKKDLATYGAKEEQELIEVMKLLEPEWMPGPIQHCGRHGMQQTYVRTKFRVIPRNIKMLSDKQ